MCPVKQSTESVPSAQGADSIIIAHPIPDSPLSYESPRSSESREEIEILFAKTASAFLQPLGKLLNVSLYMITQGSQHQELPEELNSFCRSLRSNKKSGVACMECHRNLRERARKSGGAIVETCCAGLTFFTIPVAKGPDMLGLIEGGHVFSNEADPSVLMALTRRLWQSRIVLDLKALEKAYFEIPVVARQEIDTLVKLLLSIAERLASETKLHPQPALVIDSPVVFKAKQFIEHNLMKPLTVTMVSRAAGVSETYFSKVFKRATDVPFTEYVTRLRIKSARELLLTTNLNVSEIAFECGFESISHFNRSFKRLTTFSPKTYRQSGGATNQSALTHSSFPCLPPQ